MTSHIWEHSCLYSSKVSGPKATVFSYFGQTTWGMCSVQCPNSRDRNLPWVDLTRRLISQLVIRKWEVSNIY